jgi:hypothetical protein
VIARLLFSEGVTDTEPATAPAKIFLLSPASLNGERARQLLDKGARFAAAERYRSPAGVPIGEAFTFLSSLYFRGKLTYARHFAAPPPGLPASGALVIAPGFGLVPPDWAVTEERMKKLRRTPVDTASSAYCRPLREHAEALQEALPADARVVLLGSIATGKYVDVLAPVFGGRLLFPAAFVGAGDMKRGALLLRAVRTDDELEYTTLDTPRSRRRS